MSNIESSEREFNHLTKKASTLAKSALVPSNMRGKPADIYLAMCLGRELGFSDIQALNSIHVIQGRVALAAQSMIALARRTCPESYFNFEVDEVKKVVKLTAGRDGTDKNVMTVIWDMARAASMGLTNKDNWKKQPITMLKWRAASEVCRFLFSECIMGLYTPDETEDIALEKEIDLSNPEAALNEAVREDMNNMRAEQMPEGYDIVGPDYIPQNGKLSKLKKRLAEIDPELILEEIERLDKTTGQARKKWCDALIYDLEQYLISINYEG